MTATRIAQLCALLLASDIAALASQSVQFQPLDPNRYWGNATAGYAATDASAYTAMHQLRIEFRMHDITWPTDGGTHFQMMWNSDADGAIWDGSYTKTTLCARAKWSTTTPCVDAGTLADVAYRFQIDIDAGWISLDAFNVATGERIKGWNYNNSSSLSPLSFTSGSLPAQDAHYIGFGTLGHLAYLKVYSTTVDVSTLPSESASADIADYRFDGNLIDSTGHTTMAITTAGLTAAYSATPSYVKGGSQMILGGLWEWLRSIWRGRA